jgi:hypothetical protein
MVTDESVHHQREVVRNQVFIFFTDLIIWISFTLLFQDKTGKGVKNG